MTHNLEGIKTRRKLLGIAADQLARRIGVNVQSYYRLERGQRRIYLDKALTLANYLGCSVEELGREPTLDEQKALLERAYNTRLTQMAPAKPPMPQTEEEKAAEIKALLTAWDEGDAAQ